MDRGDRKVQDICAQKRRKASVLNLYHVDNVGNHRLKIFYTDRDRVRFLKELSKVVNESFKIHFYCLMPNHFHLIVEADYLDSLSLGMCNSMREYVQYFNEVNNREGRLFKGRFYSTPIHSKQYYKACLKYILRNPIDIDITDIWSYKWSSINLHYSNDPGFLDTSKLSECFESYTHFRDYIDLKYDKEYNDFLKSWEIICLKRTREFYQNDDLDEAKKIIQTEYNVYDPKKLPNKLKIEIASFIRTLFPYMSKMKISKLLGVSIRTIQRYLK